VAPSIDRFVEDRRARWARLGDLVARAQGRVGRLGAGEVLELGSLHRAATGDLAIARRDYPSDAVAERLNDLVAASHALVYAGAPASGGRLRRFVARELPATCRAQLPFTAAALALVAIPWLVTYLAGLAFPEVAASSMSEEVRRHLVERRPGSEIPAELRPVAGPLIIANNLEVAFLAFAGGATGGLLTAWVLVANGAILGTTFAVLQRAGDAGALLTFILGHGFLELSAIFLAGGAGLRIGWALLRPGDRTRADALRLAGAEAVRALALVVATLFVAGIIEAFVSPTTLAVPAKLGVGLATGAALWAYVLLAGRTAVSQPEEPVRALAA